MTGPKTYFIELNTNNKIRFTCDIVENLYEKNVSVTVFVNDAKNAHNLDGQLWTWKQESFIPHTILNETADQSENIIITTSSSIPFQTQALVFFDPNPSIPIEKYQYIIDFAETYHPDRLKLSRQRFKQIKSESNAEPEFFKLGAFLKNFTV